MSYPDIISACNQPINLLCQLHVSAFQTISAYLRAFPVLQWNYANYIYSTVVLGRACKTGLNRYTVSVAKWFTRKNKCLLCRRSYVPIPQKQITNNPAIRPLFQDKQYLYVRRVFRAKHANPIIKRFRGGTLVGPSDPFAL